MELIEKPKIIFNDEQQNAIEVIKKWIGIYGDSIQDWIYALSGGAGTGKTTITKAILDGSGMSRASIAVSAPTHKAKKVIGAGTGYASYTAPALLGLRPDLDFAEFDPIDPLFSPIGEPKIADYAGGILAIDESSMLNEAAAKYLFEYALKYRVKILFIGDIHQIPPVKEPISTAMTIPRVVHLQTVVRQTNTNPVSELIYRSLEDVKNLTGQLPEYVYTLGNKKVYNDEGGFEVTFESNRFKEAIIELFNSNEAKSDNLHMKYLAWDNKNVTKVNYLIRRHIFQNTKELIVQGDLLTGYKSIQIKDKLTRGYTRSIINSEDYKVISCKDEILTFTVGNATYRIKVYDVTLKSLDEDAPIFIKTKILNPASQREFEIVYDYKLLQGKTKKQKYYWELFYSFKNSILLTYNIHENNDTRNKVKIAKDLDYSYAITVHKSQGSTYKNIAVNLKNLLQCPDETVRTRLIYVALSRVKNTIKLLA